MTSLVVPSAVLDRAQRIADAYTLFADGDVDAGELIGGRAGLLGIAPRGRISAGGATRLMCCRDGWCALTLSREDDIDAVPALLGAQRVADEWSAVQTWAAGCDVADVTERARLLGLPVAGLAESPAGPPRVYPFGAGTATRAPAGLVVADLSAMWAGPLCGRLLARAGATVVKVESRARPDGARSGPRTFFDWLNGGKLSYTVDFDDPDGLRPLLEAADVVIESSRPAALTRRRLGPTHVAPRDGRVWVRITGHGTDGERANWVAFGDDAAVSGGLVGGTPEEPAFRGDAIADPLTGLEAALAVAQSLRSGGGELLELSMAAVAATYAEQPDTGETDCATTPDITASAAELGADNAVVDELISRRRFAPC